MLSALSRGGTPPPPRRASRRTRANSPGCFSGLHHRRQLDRAREGVDGIGVPIAAHERDAQVGVGTCRRLTVADNLLVGGDRLVIASLAEPGTRPFPNVPRYSPDASAVLPRTARAPGSKWPAAFNARPSSTCTEVHSHRPVWRQGKPRSGRRLLRGGRRPRAPGRAHSVLPACPRVLLSKWAMASSASTELPQFERIAVVRAALRPPLQHRLPEARLGGVLRVAVDRECDERRGHCTGADGVNQSCAALEPSRRGGREPVRTDHRGDDERNERQVHSPLCPHFRGDRNDARRRGQASRTTRCPGMPVLDGRARQRGGRSRAITDGCEGPHVRERQLSRQAIVEHLSDRPHSQPQVADDELRLIEQVRPR